MKQDAGIEKRANELYWNSDTTVNDLADALDLSKGALYHAIDPLPARVECPECGSEMEFAHRTARERGIVTCPDCDFEEDIDLVRADVGDEIGRAVTEATRFPRSTVLAAGLLGAAAGLALGRLIHSSRRG